MRNFKNDFQEAFSELSGFYPYLSGLPPLTNLIASKETSYQNREILVSALQKQYKELPQIEEVLMSLKSLALTNTYTITTGHQICFGTGPLYVIYKTLTIIRQAEEWTRQNPGYQVVPIFWMASEDHDFAEANHLYLQHDEKIIYPGNWNGPVGRKVIGPEIQPLLSHPLLEWLKPYYLEGSTWAQSFRRMMHQLFGKYGLIVLDGDDPELKESFRPVFEDELKHKKVASLLDKNSTRYGLNYPVQAFVREVNLFLLENDHRYPLKPLQDGLFQGPDQRKLTLPGNYPAQSFSPSALLRPLYQEWILPNLAYCGGWAELAYWMQCGDLFRHYQIPNPALIPRYSATLIPVEVANAVNDYRSDPEELEKFLFESLWPSGPWKDQSSLILENLISLEEMVKQVDLSLVRTLDGEIHKLQSFLLEQFPKKIRKQLKNRYAELFKPIDNLRNWKSPKGEIQERNLNISAFKISPTSLIDFLYSYQGLYPGKPVIILIQEQEKR
jgi:bacillithiol biosynthesis cysteine-adding enzyme BshC